MPLDHVVAFPLHPILPGGLCGCGNPKCTRIGKHPAVLWRDLRLGDPVPARADGAGVGIKTGAAPKGSGIFVVDLDGPEASELFDELGDCDYPTYTVVTGRPGGGWQLYFQHPGFCVRNSRGELGPGIDIRGDGGYVVAPGSPHKSGLLYEAVDECDPAPAPAWLLDWLRRRPAPAEVQEYPGDVEGAERLRRKEMYARYLEKAEPCISGRGGDDQLFQVIQYGAYDLALPVQDVLEGLQEGYDDRCEPPWGDELESRVAHKAHSAKTASTRPRNVPLTLEEEEILEFEPTRLPKPEVISEDDPNCGFKIQWGGWEGPPEPLDFLVENFLVESKIAMVFAEAGSIKSWLALSLSLAVASGQAWLGERTAMKGPVLYIDFEDGQHEFHRRVHLLSPEGKYSNLGYLYTPGNLDDEKIWLRLNELHKRQPFAFLVLDTLAGGTPGTDENDRNAADALIYAGRFTEAVKARGGKVTVLVLHHANRSGEIRGTSAFKANVDTLFKLETIKDEGGVHQAKLTCTKSGQRKVATIYLELTDEGLSRFEPEQHEVDDPKIDKRSLDELQEEVLLTIGTFAPIGSVDKLRVLVKAKTNTVSAVVKELLAKGDIYKDDSGYRPDNEEKRRQRLAETIRVHEDWSKGKLIAQSFVSGGFFDQCRRDGHVVPRCSGHEVEGFLWVEK